MLVLTVSWVVETAVIRVGTFVNEDPTTHTGTFGNAVPLKFTTPVVATPPVPTLMDPASGVLPATIEGDVPKPDAIVGNASTLNTDPIASEFVSIDTKPSAVLRK